MTNTSWSRKRWAQWIRDAGKKDRKRLLRFLKAHAGTMPRPMLRNAVEQLAPEVRAKYVSTRG